MSQAKVYRRSLLPIVCKGEWLIKIEAPSPTADQLRAWLIEHPDKTWSGRPSWESCPLACLLLEDHQSDYPDKVLRVATDLTEWMGEFTQAFDAASMGWEDFETPTVLTSADVLKILDALPGEPWTSAIS